MVSKFLNPCTDGTVLHRFWRLSSQISELRFNRSPCLKIKYSKKGRHRPLQSLHMLTDTTVALFQIWMNSKKLSVTQHNTHTLLSWEWKKGSESKRTFTKKEKRKLEQGPRIRNEKGHWKHQLRLIKREKTGREE